MYCLDALFSTLKVWIWDTADDNDRTHTHLVNTRYQINACQASHPPALEYVKYPVFKHTHTHTRFNHTQACRHCRLAPCSFLLCESEWQMKQFDFYLLHLVMREQMERCQDGWLVERDGSQKDRLPAWWRDRRRQKNKNTRERGRRRQFN